MALDLSKVPGVPKWAFGMAITVGIGWGGRTVYINDLASQEQKCLTAITASEKHSQELFATKAELAASELGHERDLRQIMLLLPRTR